MLQIHVVSCMTMMIYFIIDPYAMYTSERMLGKGCVVHLAQVMKYVNYIK